MKLVTGGCGFIGAALVKALVQSGQNVRVFDNMSRGSPKRLSDCPVDEIVQGDVRDSAAVVKAAEGCDEIIHLACINGTENFYKHPGAVLDVGLRGMQSVLDAVSAHEIPTLVLASSSEVYQNPPVIPTPEMVPMTIPNPYNPRYSYATVKIASEMQALHNCKANRVLILRPHNIYGPDMGNEHVIPQMAKRLMESDCLVFNSSPPDAAWTGPRPFWGGGETRAFCYIDDAVDQIMAVREHGQNKDIYNIGTDEETRIIDLAQKIADRCGKPLKVVQEGGEGERSGGALRRCPDMTKTFNLGCACQWNLDRGLTTTLAWYWGGVE